MKFPRWIHLGPNCTRWRLSDLEAYEARCSGGPEPLARSPENERYMSVRQVAERYETSVPTIWRWARSGKASGAHQGRTAA